jgi:hypothetical protein
MTPEQIEEAIQWFPEDVKQVILDILSRIDTLEGK